MLVKLLHDHQQSLSDVHLFHVMHMHLLHATQTLYAVLQSFQGLNVQEESTNAPILVNSQLKPPSVHGSGTHTARLNNPVRDAALLLVMPMHLGNIRPAFPQPPSFKRTPCRDSALECSTQGHQCQRVNWLATPSLLRAAAGIALLPAARP